MKGFKERRAAPVRLVLIRASVPLAPTPAKPKPVRRPRGAKPRSEVKV